MIFNTNYDYLLFRQDINGAESIYFTRWDINDVIKRVVDGRITVHPNYSVLFAKNVRAYNKFKADIGCYKKIWEEEKS